MKMQVFSRNFSIYSFLYGIYSYCVFHLPLRERKKPPRSPVTETGAVHLHYSCFLKPSRHYLRGFLIAAWAGAKITERSDLRYYVIWKVFSLLLLCRLLLRFLLILAFLGHKGCLQYFHRFSTAPTIPAFKQSLDSDYATIPVSRYNLLPTKCWLQYGKNGFQFEVDLLMSVVLLLCNPTHLCFYTS